MCNSLKHEKFNPSDEYTNNSTIHIEHEKIFACVLEVADPLFIRFIFSRSSPRWSGVHGINMPMLNLRVNIRLLSSRMLASIQVYVFVQGVKYAQKAYWGGLILKAVHDSSWSIVYRGHAKTTRLHEI